MANAYFTPPVAVNEPVFDYAPGTPEREGLQSALKKLSGEVKNIPMVIDGKAVETGDLRDCTMPHNHQHVYGKYHYGNKTHVQQAVDSCLAAKKQWSELSWEHRASIFLRVADLITTKYRYEINAGTMLTQSKTAFQSEIDAVCEFADFIRFNVQYMTEIYAQQPESSDGMWNRLEYRPLEGFTFAITPFNFTAIAGNLPFSPVLMGNVCVWKPADSQVYSSYQLMEIFQEAGLPDGVINMVYCEGPDAGDVIFNHPEFAGLHFTGSTKVFKSLWKTIGNNIDIYKSYPRIVGETGGKDFVVAHKSAPALEVATALSRGAFEFQGQKCSAASRAYISESIWPDVKKHLVEQVESFKMGGVEDFSNFVTAVIDKRSFDKCKSYLDIIKEGDAEIIVGGGCDDSKGYFVEPTVAVVKDPKFKTMCEEIFGPILTLYVYKDDEFETVLDLVNDNEYALTGSIIAKDRYVIDHVMKRLRDSAGNFYINDKPTGAVVGQQPFGGGRGSGTNDKAGSYLNLLRWTSPRTIKETFVTPSDYRYPFMG